MKKFLSLTLALVMILAMFTFASCGSKDPKEIFTEAMENMQNVTDLAMTAEGNITIGIMGMNVEMPLTADVALKGLKSDDLTSLNDAKISMSLNMNAMGEEVDMDIYLADGYMYMNAMGETAKSAVGELFPADFELNETNELTDKLSAKLEEATTYTKNKDGSVTASCSIPEELYSEILSATMTSEDMASLGLGGIELAVDTCNVTVKDGKLAGCDIAMSCTMETEGQEMTMAIKLDADFTAYGDKVVITPPEGYESYPEA